MWIRDRAVSVPIALIFLYLTIKQSEKIENQNNSALLDMVSLFVEYVRGIPVLKSFSNNKSLDNELMNKTKKFGETRKVASRFKACLLYTSLNSFTDEEIKRYDKDGLHVIGMIHDKKEETTEKQFPKGIYDYWTDYRFCSDNKYKNPNYIITYFRRGNEAFNYSGENEDRWDYICKGIVKLINNINGTIKIYDKGNLFNSMLKELQEDKAKIFRNKMLNLISCINDLSEYNWADVLLKIQSLINLFFDDEKCIEGIECCLFYTSENDSAK